MKKEQIVHVEIRSDDSKIIKSALDMVTDSRADCRGHKSKSADAYSYQFDVTESGFQTLQNEFTDNDNLSIVEISRSLPLGHQEIISMVRDRETLGLIDNIEHLSDINNFSFYTPVEDIENILKMLHRKFPAITQLISVENLTEGKLSTPVMHIGAPLANDKDCILIVGGMHSDEWVPTEGVLYFAHAICDAYLEENDINFGGYSFSNQDVKSYLEKYNLVLIPCLNPDGRAFTQSANGDETWRKNRSTKHLGNRDLDLLNPKEIGVDINRNFDIAWDLEKFAKGHVETSDLPSETTYQGAFPHSEAETQNLEKLFDRFPNCRFYIDVHSYGEYILYPWAIDTNQFHDPDMNEGNPDYDGMRGKREADYQEYMLEQDHKNHVLIAETMGNAIRQATGKKYQCMEASELYGLWPETSDGRGIAGASPDYAYSRHLLENRNLNKVFGFTIECGKAYTDKRPKILRARTIIKEVCSALCSACKALEEGDRNGTF
jgi:carboxypeptidase T